MVAWATHLWWPPCLQHSIGCTPAAQSHLTSLGYLFLLLVAFKDLTGNSGVVGEGWGGGEEETYGHLKQKKREIDPNSLIPPFLPVTCTMAGATACPSQHGGVWSSA